MHIFTTSRNRPSGGSHRRFFAASPVCPVSRQGGPVATVHPKALEVIVRLHSPWLSHLVSRAEHTATAEAATSRRRAIAAECNGAARQRMKPQEAQCCGMQLCETQNKPSRQKERSCVHDAVISQPVAYSREFSCPEHSRLGLAGNFLFPSDACFQQAILASACERLGLKMQ